VYKVAYSVVIYTNVVDSKKLKESERDRQFGILDQTAFAGHLLVILSAEELSNKMLRRYVFASRELIKADRNIILI